VEDVVTPTKAFWSGKRVLLTGHTGFKGTWCALWLRQLGAEVFGLALEPDTTPAIWNIVGRPAEAGSIGDVRDASFVKTVFETARPDIVIHMAAQALVHPSYLDPATTFDTNVMGLVRVLDAARSTPSVRAVVNVTSDKCYENREQVWAYRETEAMGGSDPYSASKGCAELVTSSYRRSYFNKIGGPQLASGRAGNVIGGGDWSVDRLFPDCVRAFGGGQPVMIRNPLATRPWQHVLEPVSGYLVLAEALFERGGEIADGWNFGPPDDDAWTVGRVVERITALWGEGSAWRQDEASWPKEAMLLRVDATKARVRLGWRPRLTTGGAIAWTVDWYKAVRDGRDARDVTLEQIERYEALAQTRESVST
jgi:CDP-glucose 4,6-dehydratase